MIKRKSSGSIDSATVKMLLMLEMQFWCIFSPISPSNFVLLSQMNLWMSQKENRFFFSFTSIGSRELLAIPWGYFLKESGTLVKNAERFSGEFKNLSHNSSKMGLKISSKNSMFCPFGALFTSEFFQAKRNFYWQVSQPLKIQSQHISENHATLFFHLNIRCFI